MLSNGFLRGLAVLVVVLCGAVSLTACGGSGTDTQALAEAEEHGAEEQKEKEKGQRLQRKIEKIERERREEKKRKRERQRQQNGADDGGSGSPSPTPAPPPTSEPSGTSCGNGVTAGPETTCEFALNVQAEYFAVVGEGSGEFEAYSPKLDQWFPMYCTGAPHSCNGAITATVYFP